MSTGVAQRKLLGFLDALFLRDGQPKERSPFPYLHSNNPRRRSHSLQRPAAFRKNHTENIGSISQHTRRLQRFDAFRSRGHVARGFKRFIRIGAEIWRSLRRLFCIHRSHLHRRVVCSGKPSDGFGFHWIGPDLPSGCCRTRCIARSGARIRSGPGVVRWTTAEVSHWGQRRLAFCAPKSIDEFLTCFLLWFRREHKTLSLR